MHDLRFTNARICDGSGAPIFDGELAIGDGRIAEVGASVGPAREEVDAQGYVLSPGFIDNHTHYDAQLTWDPFASPSLGVGVTTLLMGNCGFTIAPCRHTDRELTLKNLTQVEGMSLDALLTGTRSDYETFDEYLGMLESLGVVPNVAVYCGHSSLRTWVMGADAVKRTATDQELGQMKALLGRALSDGALGFATSTFEGHNGWGGTPMPSRFASRDELAQLVGVLGEHDRGCFMLTKGRDSDIAFLETLAADSGRMVAVAAIQYDHANPTRAFDDMRGIGEAVSRGRQMVGQVACTPISMDFTLRSAYLFEALSSFRPAIARYSDRSALSEFYKDRDFREQMKKELVAAGSLNRFTDQWHLLEILEVANDQHRELEHRTVGELADAEGVHPLDWLLDFGEREGFETLFNAQILNADEEAVAKLLTDPNASIGLADAGAHLFLFCDADYGLHLLGRWVRELGVFTLEGAIEALTSKQAEVYGLNDRGLLRPGYHADLLLFDPERVGRGEKRRVHDLPAGASRLVRSAVGIEGIWVNGVRVVDRDGVRDIAARPGQVLRSFS